MKGTRQKYERRERCDTTFLPLDGDRASGSLSNELAEGVGKRGRCRGNTRGSLERNASRNRPTPLRSRRVCRFCLTESEPLSFIYERDHNKPFQVPLTLQIMSCVAIEVYAADGMPQMICNMCRWNLDRSYKFKSQCKKADEALRAYPLSGVLPRPFPPIPNDPPESGTKRLAEQRTQNENVKKPRVDNGDRDRRDNRERDRDRERERERERERQSEKAREKSESRHDFYEEDQDAGSEGEQESNDTKEERAKLEPGEIRHIEAGEKMGPDGLQPDNKNKVELDSEEEEEEEEQYSDGDDDYEPPAYIIKKLPKSKPTESEEEVDRVDKEDRKEHVVYVRGKDGNMVKKTIKTLMPVQRREVQDTKTKANPSNAPSNVKTTQLKDESQKSARVDDTEAQVQKIVASVFKEHKIPLKHQNVVGQELAKDGTPSSSSGQSVKSQTSSQSSQGQVSCKEEKVDISTISGTPKSVNTVKVIKRIVVRKPGTSGETSTVTTSTSKESGESSNLVTQATSSSGHKVTKRVIVRRIIRQGDTTREVIMNPDGTIIDPAELAKLPTGNVVKRVIVKKPLDKSSGLVQAVLQSSPDTRPTTTTLKTNESMSTDSPKFELKTSQSSNMSSSTSKTTVAQKASLTKGDQETKEKLEQLEKRVEQQRLKIEELQARKQQEYEPIDEMLPERHDESEDEQQLPLKRVFVKRKQSIYDEEQEYNDDVKPVAYSGTSEKEDHEQQETKDDNQDNVPKLPIVTTTATTTTTMPTITTDSVQIEVPSLSTTVATLTTVPPPTTTALVLATPISTSRKEPRQTTLTSSKVYANKKIIVVKSEETSEVDEMNRELSSILDSADTVAKIQETVLTNLTQISAVADNSQKSYASDKLKGTSSHVTTTASTTPMEIEETTIAEQETINDKEQEENLKLQRVVTMDVLNTQVIEFKPELEQATEQIVEQDDNQESTLTLDTQDLSESTDIFEPSDNVLDVQKNDNTLEDSVIELHHENDTINLNDTNDSQDSLEDKLSQMEG
ncbi:zinc finger CCCH domain-containing protein 13-like isoform X2 [Vespula maculifrons]|uniref:Zinc finger CCCH domain-containing protein 13-like isoform X2 n=1 Tax=Vespula maculifrons TaxID=7453 RepID=A0ABD2CTV7_VESMC